MIETVPNGKVDVALLAQMKTRFGIDPATAGILLDALQSPDAERVRTFLAMSVGKNDERGFKKFCPSCNDFTGHLVLPGSAWYFERCFRCRKVRAWRIVHPRLPPFGKAVIMPPGMDAKGVLRLALEVAGPEYVARCVEVYMKKRVAARTTEMIQELKLQAMEAHLSAPSGTDFTRFE